MLLVYFDSWEEHGSTFPTESSQAGNMIPCSPSRIKITNLLYCKAFSRQFVHWCNVFERILLQQMLWSKCLHIATSSNAPFCMYYVDDVNCTLIMVTFPLSLMGKYNNINNVPHYSLNTFILHKHNLSFPMIWPQLSFWHLLKSHILPDTLYRSFSMIWCKTICLNYTYAQKILF